MGLRSGVRTPCTAGAFGQMDRGKVGGSGCRVSEPRDQVGDRTRLRTTFYVLGTDQLEAVSSTTNIHVPAHPARRRCGQSVSGNDGTDAGHYHRPCPPCRDVDGAFPVIRSSVSPERPMAWETMQTRSVAMGKWALDGHGVGRATPQERARAFWNAVLYS